VFASHVKCLGLVGVVAIVLTSACSADKAASAAAPGTGCGGQSVTKWAAIDPKSPDEPAVRLPQPTDWKRVNWQDMQSVRLMLRNDSLGKLVPPSVAVAIDDATGRAADPQAVIDAERAKLKQPEVTDISDSTAKVCGFTATTFSYRSGQGAQGPRLVKTVVIVPQYNNKMFDVVVTAQAGDAGDDALLTDAQSILAGMEIKAPAGH
jgi:hypothetical protein